MKRVAWVFLAAFPFTLLAGEKNVDDPEMVVRSFVGRVSDIANVGRNNGGNAIRIGNDPRWMLKVDELKSEKEPVVIGPLVYYIHSPVLLLRGDGDSSIGVVYRFKETARMKSGFRWLVAERMPPPSELEKSTAPAAPKNKSAKSAKPAKPSYVEPED